MRKVILLFFIGLYCFSVAQPPKNFYRTIGGEGDDIGYSCKVTLDHNYIVAGSTSSFGNNNTDFYLVKVDSMGNGLWHQHYGGAGIDVARSVIQLPDSGYLMVGYTSSFGSGGYDILMVCTDKVGTQKWQKTFGGADWDFGQDAVLGTDLNIYLVGFTESFGNGKRDGIVIKLDTLGNILKSSFFGGSENDELRSIIKTNDGQLATVGVTESYGDLNGDLYFIKLDYTLDTLFTRRMGGNQQDYANDITQNKIDNNYYLCGAKTYSNYPKTRSYMYRLSAIGNFVSDSNYYRNTIDESFISVTTSKITYNNMPLTAFARTVYYPISKYQAETFVALPGGNSHIVNASGLYNDEFVYSIEATNDGGYVSVGSTNGFGAQGQDIYFMKQDSTIANYASIVGIEKSMEINDQKKFFYIEDNKLIVNETFKNEILRIKIIDFLGNTLKQFSELVEYSEFDLSHLISNFYIIQFDFKDGTSKCQKFNKVE